MRQIHRAGEKLFVDYCVQPIDGLTAEKFMFCAYTLAVFTDRLEYVIQKPDVY